MISDRGSLTQKRMQGITMVTHVAVIHEAEESIKKLGLAATNHSNTEHLDLLLGFQRALSESKILCVTHAKSLRENAVLGTIRYY